MKIVRQRAVQCLHLLLCCALLVCLFPKTASAAPVKQEGDPAAENELFLPVVTNRLEDPSQLEKPDESANSSSLLSPQQYTDVTPELVFYHHDATGNLVALTEDSGEVVWRADVRVFGQGVTDSPDFPMHFLGQPREEENGAEGGLYYLGARYYDPLTGRFLSPDPQSLTEVSLNNPQRLNRYAYALNNPLRYVDSTGLAASGWKYPEAVEWASSLLKNSQLNPYLRTLLEESYLRNGEEAWKALYNNRYWLLHEGNSINRIRAVLEPILPELKAAGKYAAKGAKLAGKVTGVLLIFYIVSGSEALASEDYGTAAKTFADATIVGAIADGAELAGLGKSEEFFELATTWWGDQIYEWLNEDEAK